ncbi:MAG: DsbA family protein [Deltaproteobacteria bacterium]|nr:DsbA family protein [Deltaproteobacteria bacterium]
MQADRQILWMVVVWLAALVVLPRNAESRSVSVEETLAALGNGPTLGTTVAPVTIIEFSDFQCTFCKKFWADTLPGLKETHIKKGQVRFTYRHFAILGKRSVEAAKGAECAGEQGKFWEYHDKLFSNQGGLAFTNAKLRRYAQELGLEMRPFSRCLDSDTYVKKIEGETAVAAFLGARGTPTFFVNGRLLAGAQPFEAFQNVIEDELRKSRSKKKRR